MSDQAENDFLRDVANHRMQVIRDDGVYRHIRFARPNTMCMHFDLITWPGHLCYAGDMGTYVFQRLTDMFEFFRSDRKDGKLRINLGYWTEKLVAVDGSRHGGNAKEFCQDKFRRIINEYRIGWMRSTKANRTLDKEQRRELWEEVESEILDKIEDGGDRAIIAAHDFVHRVGRVSWAFDDLWEYDFTEYTHRIVWCCYALAWGIQQYDNSKIAEAV